MTSCAIRDKDNPSFIFADSSYPFTIALGLPTFVYQIYASQHKYIPSHVLFTVLFIVFARLLCCFFFVVGCFFYFYSFLLPFYHRTFVCNWPAVQPIGHSSRRSIWTNWTIFYYFFTVVLCVDNLYLHNKFKLSLILVCCLLL